MKKSHKAFTLSEVLVTLGIIGVVSALTVPNLVKNHQRHVYVTQLRKVYSEITQALDILKVDAKAISLAETKLVRANGAEYFFKNYMKTTSIEKNSSACMASSYDNMNGDTFTLSAKEVCATLADGASIQLTVFKRNSFISLQYSVDVNGKQGPNILGRDLFTFDITKENELYFGGDLGIKTYATEKFDRDCIKGTTHGGSWGGNYDACMARVVYDGWAMDY